jgi:hypothetical protein
MGDLSVQTTSMHVQLGFCSLIGESFVSFSGRDCCRRTGSLDVTDDRTGLVIHELNAHLGDTTTRTCNPRELISLYFA